jgi:hypothetical protein
MWDGLFVAAPLSLPLVVFLTGTASAVPYVLVCSAALAAGVCFSFAAKLPPHSQAKQRATTTPDTSDPP